MLPTEPDGAFVRFHSGKCSCICARLSSYTVGKFSGGGGWEPDGGKLHDVSLVIVVRDRGRRRHINVSVEATVAEKICDIPNGIHDAVRSFISGLKGQVSSSA